jgi:putative acetyltransferase
VTVRIRRERPADRPQVQRIIESAFTARNPSDEPVPEPALNDRLREDPGWIPDLTLVAESDGVIVGQVTSSYGWLERDAADPSLGVDAASVDAASVDAARVVGVGPVSVLPSHQGRGIGSTLLRALIAAADARDEPLLMLLGSPDFYARFGFVAATDVGIQAPDPLWGRHFQARTLTAHDPGMVGRYRYAAPFDAL